MKRSFSDRVGRERLYCDGGTGSLLQARGLKPGELPETWNLVRPEDVIQIAEDYYRAGSDIVNTNTFGANALKYPGNLREIVEAAVACVKEARKRAGREDAYVALDIGPTGKLLEPMGDLPFEKAVELFGEVARIGTEAGADLILIETMSDSYEAKAAVLGAKENSHLPVCITLTYDRGGKLLTGGTVASTTAMLEGLGVTALGMNCGLGPAQMLPLVEELLSVTSLPVIINPNAGLPRSENGCTVYDLDPDTFSGLMTKIAKAGAHVLGGCCGTTPDHIRAEIAACRDIPFREPVRKHRTVVSSFSKTVEIGQVPQLVGERINPTGKKRLQQALREEDMDYILSQAIEQEEAGAHILDVNVGLPGIDEAAMMRKLIPRIQAITALPLQIDTSDATALEAALRVYNGKAMVNSVTGKRESLEMVLPVVKKYGGVLVGLPLDEEGIPKTAGGRLEIASRIYEEAEKAGIGPEELLIDGLAMTISADSGSAEATLETLRRVRDDLKGHTILGVSNISFGLPRREIINATFFAMALQAGLSCAIMNPNNEAMMRSYRSYLALAGLDANCMGYIEACQTWTQDGSGGAASGTGKAGTGGSAENGSTPAGTAEKSQPGRGSGSMSLAECVERGLEGQAAEAARQALASRDPLEIINEDLVPALDHVGKGFESGHLFLPQLLMSAEAAQAAFSVIREAMAGREEAEKGTIILATVKNDIHDIGKNIVKVMLENYGYRIIDLGKDVAPESVLEAARQEKVKLVGLSALMTTTVSSMEETVRLLHKELPGVQVMVGGAVLTEEYAADIGADAYAGDAMGAVRIADSVFGIS